ncbi:glutamine amidotransferase [Corynebacterium lowii]|uniref:Glutamine amidotransferase n=1 Tax=Corynebacterium lowii TaxID=1544413 RepID=A0A0N8W058_9CORY|nr:glutamine amidotransferase [Corynebacterium lowii]KQB85778.1 glutamine amidotransferase [Corynebacterium lowii]MDP9851080.1 GMP synthase (glutamine-hydrolyzing) [Corynebacterium lowii]
MSLFLLLSPRRGAAVAASEYRDFLNATGLRSEQLEQRMLDSAESRVGSLEGYAGIFVGGSSLNMTTPVYDAWQRTVIRELSALIDGPLPVFFACFGTALITQVLGGEIGHEYGEKAGSSQVELTEAGREDPLFGSLPSSFMALTGHTECVLTLPPQAVAVASGPTCPVQALRVGRHTWSSQFHAEMNPEGMASRMSFYRNHGYFSEDEYDSIVESLRDVDTQHAHQILRNFVEYCRCLIPDYTGKVCMPS